MKIFFLIFFVIFFINCLLICSSFKINIKEFEVDTTTQPIIVKYNIKIGIYFISRIRLIGITITKKRVENIKKIVDSKFINRIISKCMNNSIIKKIENKVSRKIEQKIKKNLKNINYSKKEIVYIIKKILKHLKLESKKMNLELLIGTEDIFITTFLIPVISIMFLVFFKITAKKINRNYSYKISPVYNKNLIKLSLNCILQVKLVHIINIIYILLIKKGRSDKYERTSNRRAYGYSYE